MNLSAFILLSLALHVFSLVFPLKGNENTEKPYYTVSLADPQQEEPSPRKKVKVAWLNGNARARSQLGPPPLSLSDLGIQGSRIWSEEAKGGAAGSGASGNGVLESAKDTVPLEWLYEQLDNALIYPGEFIDAGIEGSVSGVLEFDEHGNLLKGHRRIKSSSNFLKVYALRKIDEVLANPIPHKLRKEGLRVSVCDDLRASLAPITSMELSDDANKGRAAQRGVLGYTFQFYRASKVIGQWTLGPISGYGIAPSIGISPDWFVDAFGKVVDKLKHKAEIDPLDSYRNDPRWGGLI